MTNYNSLHDAARKYRRRMMFSGGLVTAILVTACLLMLLILLACTDNAIVTGLDDYTPADADALRFEISIAQAEEAGTTRALTDASFRTTFEPGDAIGIFAVDAENPVLAATGNLIHNARLTLGADGTTWQGNIYWPDGFTGSLHFFAYYPYDDCGGRPETLDPTAYTFRALTDQNATATAGRDPYSLSDLMGAYNYRENSKDDLRTGSVSLSFRHLMAMVQVSVPAGNKTYGPDETLTVRLNNVRTEAKLNLNLLRGDAGKATNIALANPQSDPTTLILRRVEQPGDADYATTYTYRALLPVQDVPQGTRLIRMDYGPWSFADAPLTDKLQLLGAKADVFTRALPAEAKIMSTAFIPAGTFLMGSSDGSNIGDADGSGLNTTPAEAGRSNNEAQHRVTLTRGFYMSRYEVTNAQYAAFLNDIKCGENGKADVTGYGEQLLIEKDNELGVQWNNDVWSPATGKADFPVVRVTWYGARAYADWAGASLPTEAQWEYACRAGSTTAYTGGDDVEHGLGDYGWYRSNSGNIAHPVGTKKPNAWGLYDMHGNASEWCADLYDYNYGSTPGAPATDPAGPNAGYSRTLRGGSFSNVFVYCRSAWRSNIGPGSVYSDLGFRVVFNE